jgi:uncharacterized repeat protein (TIGR01451 family)
MKLLQKISNKLRLTSRKSKVIASLVIGAALLTVGAVAYAGYTTSGSVMDWNNPADQVGSTDGPVFNHFINTPYYGDERAFFDAARSDEATQTSGFKDVQPDVGEGSSEVILRMYIHNNANQDTNASGLGVAKDTTVHITLPTGTVSDMQTRAYIDWSNPAPGYTGEVTDSAELTDSSPFSIQYEPGSAVIYNGAHPGGYTLPDSIVTTGTKVGYDQMDGNWPGCFNYQAFIEIKVKVLRPSLSITKQVRAVGSTTYSKDIAVQPGDKEQWMLTIQNNGKQNLTGLDVRDLLPPHVSVVPGSVRYIDANQDVVQQDQPLFTTGGIDLGTSSWIPTSGFYIRFDTTANDDFDGCSVTVRNLAYAKSNETPTEVQDYSDVTINKPNCVTTTPTYTCNLHD